MCNGDALNPKFHYLSASFNHPEMKNVTNKCLSTGKASLKDLIVSIDQNTVV